MLTFTEQAAIAAMQSMLTTNPFPEPEKIAKQAVEFALALKKELDDGQA
jgi:hypothetical protein